MRDGWPWAQPWCSSCGLGRKGLWRGTGLQLDVVSTSVSLLSRKTPSQPELRGFNSLSRSEGEGAACQEPPSPMADPLAVGFVRHQRPGAVIRHRAGGRAGSTEGCQPKGGKCVPACGQHCSEAAVFPSDASVLGPAPAEAGSVVPRTQPGEGAWRGGRSDSAVTVMSWGHTSVWGSVTTTPAAAPWPTLSPPAISDRAQPGVKQGL